MSGAGMDTLQVTMEGIGNNIANVSTPGFKKDNYLLKTFPEMLMIEKNSPMNRLGNLRYRFNRPVGISGIGNLVTEVKVDYAMGNAYETNNNTDLMLKGDAFFTVDYATKDDPGQTAYTRNGAFRVDENGYLVTAGGHRVQGENGGIYIGDNELGFTVKADGTIVVDDVKLDKLKLVEFDDLEALYKLGDDMFLDGGGTGRVSNETIIYQGFLEGSNVNPVDEMVKLINTVKAYETSQRVIQTQDELLAKAVNQVGTIR